MTAPTPTPGAAVTLWTPAPELYDQLARLTPGTSLRVFGDFRGQLVDITIPATEPTTDEVRARMAHTQVLSLSLTPTPERLAELREAVRNAPATPMPIVLEPKPATAWTVIDRANPDTLPAQGRWLVTVDTDSGREVHTLVHAGGGKWMHEGEYTFQHGYMFRPIAWAPRPEAYAGEVQQ